MVRGVAGFAILPDDVDKFVFLKRARKPFDGDALTCLVWALMTNHGHLVSRTGGTDLSAGMHQLNTEYGSYFNRRHRRQGHVFQNRFKSLLIEEETYLLRAVRYVLLNPIKGDLVRDLDELADYPWTSFPALMGRSADRLGDVEFTLRLFADRQDVARRELRDWLLDGLANPDPFERLIEMPTGRPPKELEEELHAALIGDRDSYAVGNSRFISTILSAANAPRAARRPFVPQGWDLDGLLSRVCTELTVNEADLRLGRRYASVSKARAAVAWIGTAYLGVSHTDLALELGVSRPAISKALARGKAVTDEQLGSLLSELSVAAAARRVS